MGFASTVDAKMIVAEVSISILTLLFLILAIFSWLEFTGITRNNPIFQDKIFGKSKLNKNIHTFFNNAEAIEIAGFNMAGLVFIMGMATLYTTGYFVIVGAAVMLLFYNSYFSRVKIKLFLRVTLPKHSEISLKKLAKMIGQDRDRIQKALVELISLENFPADLNIENQTVKYVTATNVTAANVTATNTTQFSTAQVTEQTPTETKKTAVVPSKMCIYCGEVIEAENPKFCTACGASLAATK